MLLNNEEKRRIAEITGKKEAGISNTDFEIYLNVLKNVCWWEMCKERDDYRSWLKNEKLRMKKQLDVLEMPANRSLEVIKEKRKDRIKFLKNLGIKARNNGMSLYFNNISPGCITCSKFMGYTAAPTMQCNRKCFSCHVEASQVSRKDIHIKCHAQITNIIERIIKHKPDSLPSFAVTGGEPLLAVDATLALLIFAKVYAGEKCQTRLYTNGDMINQDILERLKANKLDEIRFGIEPDMKKIRLAKKYIPRVMVELPVFPDEEEKMKEILISLNDIGIFGINLKEVAFSCRNASVYKRKGYELMTDRFNCQVIPDFQFYPLYRSEEVCFNLLEFAAKNNISISVHYCSVNNRRYGNIKEIVRNFKDQ